MPIPLDFASRTHNKTECRGVTENESGQLLVVPAKSPHSPNSFALPVSSDFEASTFMQIAEEVSKFGTFASYIDDANAVWKLDTIFGRVAAERQRFLDDVSDIKRVWIEEGKQYSKEVAKKVSRAREAIQQVSRENSVLPKRYYEIIDSARRGGANVREMVREAVEERRSGVTKKLAFGPMIERSMSSNKYVDAIATVSGKTAKVLQSTGMKVVVALPLAHSTLKLLTSDTVEEANTALAELAGIAVGGTVTTLGGAFCSAVTVPTIAGPFLCGTAALSGGILAGNAAEHAVAEFLNLQK